MMQQAFRAMILASTSITSKTAQRVEYGLRPQGQMLPAIALTVVDDGPVNRSLNGAGLHRAIIQVDCYCQTYKDAAELADAVRIALDSKATTGIQAIFLNGARDLSETDGVTPIHRVNMEFTVTHNPN